MMMGNYKEQLRNIKALIFDYDGVLSDGTVLLLTNGDHVRTGYVKDGYAIQLAIKKGFKIAVISGGYSEAMATRCHILGVKDAFLGVKDKALVFVKYLSDNNLQASEVLFMGDDIPDYPVMKQAGMAVCPADAAEEIKSVSVYISQYGGGKGCVRDIIEQVLKVQGLWMDQDAFTW
jgi:3-deoxy-D-manno-octulosonate 8-phosphate phosphatase (KDO 8-P phosphatase)